MTANLDNCNRAHSMAENARERCTTTDVHKSHQIQILFFILILLLSTTIITTATQQNNTNNRHTTSATATPYKKVFSS